MVAPGVSRIPGSPTCARPAIGNEKILIFVKKEKIWKPSTSKSSTSRGTALWKRLADAPKDYFENLCKAKYFCETGTDIWPENVKIVAGKKYLKPAPNQR